jgi:hypothetical protein
MLPGSGYLVVGQWNSLDVNIPCAQLLYLADRFLFRTLSYRDHGDHGHNPANNPKHTEKRPEFLLQ